MKVRNVIYRKMRTSEAIEVAALVSNVFTEYVSPQYSGEGIEEFFRYADAEGMIRRSFGNHFILVAQGEPQIVGMIEVRDFEHISLLFVDSGVQRHGIGRELVHQAAKICLESDRSSDHLTVNSSPNAVDAYREFGFQESGGEQEANGIRFVPMTKVLTNIV